MKPRYVFSILLIGGLISDSGFAHHGKEFLVSSTYKTPEQGGFFALFSTDYMKGDHHPSEFEFSPGMLYGSQIDGAQNFIHTMGYLRAIFTPDHSHLKHVFDSSDQETRAMGRKSIMITMIDPHFCLQRFLSTKRVCADQPTP